MQAVFLSAERYANPYPLARWLRERDPVHWSTEFQAWVLTRYAEVAASRHDPRLSIERRLPVDLAAKGWEHVRPLFTTVGRMFGYRDAPEHTRLRQAVHQAFTRSAIEPNSIPYASSSPRLCESPAPIPATRRPPLIRCAVTNACGRACSRSATS